MTKPLSALALVLALVCAFLAGCGGGSGDLVPPPAADASPEADCTQDAKRCLDKTPQVCDAGQWQDLTICQYLCVNGACTGECAPSSQQCQGLVPRTCDADGHWQDGTACPFVCANGACSGSCAPGDRRCTGQTPQTCDTQGQWVSTAACSHQTCLEGICQGVCGPGDIGCDGTIPRTCDAFGQWQDGTVCPFLCVNGACTGECVPGSQQCQGLVPQTCDANGQWQDGTTCEYGCQNGACTGVCQPGSVQCDGNTPETCDANGSWQPNTTCPFLCVNGACTGECVPGSQQCQGLMPQTCDASGHWQDGTACPFVCANGACSGVCFPGSKQCNGNTAETCDAAGQWSDTVCSGQNPACCNGTCVIPVAEISIDRFHACARKADNTLWCWGRSDAGMLGDGQVDGQPCGTAGQTCRPDPVQVTALGNSVAQVSVGSMHTCARKADKTVWCWGFDFYGTGYQHSAPVQAVSLGSDVSEIAAGLEFTCARKTDGTLWCWGKGDQGQLGYGYKPYTITTPVQVTALGNSVAQVSVGNLHTCARKTDGTLWCWGNNNWGQLGDGTATGENCGSTYVCKPSPVQVTALGTNVIDVIASIWFTCARKSDETVWCWGSNVGGELGIGSTSGTACYGHCMSTPVQVTALGTNTNAMFSRWHSCIIKQDTSLWCWGANSYGQLGDGTTTNQASPVLASLFTGNTLQVAIGEFSTCAIKNGSVWCLGINDYGQLGNGTLDDQPVPIHAMCH